MLGKIRFAAAALTLGASLAAHADTYTYKYVGPSFTGKTDHVEVTFTTSAPLAPSTSYLHLADAGVISGAVTVVGPNGVVSGFTLPITWFQVHTNATASATVPGIDSWDVMGEAKSLTGTAPAMSGTDFQAYTMNTMLFIPGSDIPGATSLVTGHYNYDQGTEVTFYSTYSECLLHAGCSVAGNGQPYVGNYSGIVNPSGTSPASWSMTSTATTPPPPPPPAPLAIAGTLPNGTVGVAYSSTALSASGGVAPYTWSASGLPAGLAIDASTGAISGTPTSAATYTFTATVTDSTGSTLSGALSIVIGPAPVACSATGAVISGVNKFWLDFNGGLSGGGQSVTYAPQSATTFTGGTTGFAVGELVDYAGTLDGIGMCNATRMIVKPAPAPAPAYSCTAPAGAKSAHAKNKITAVGADYIVVGTVKVQVPSCTVISWNGAAGFAVGQRAEYQGYVLNGVTVAQKITIN